MRKFYLFLASACLLCACGDHSTEKEKGIVPDPDYLYPMETVADDFAFVDVRTGEELPGRFASAEMFRDGLALVRDKSSLRYGYIDPSGSYAIEPKYVSATFFSDGLAFVALPDSGLVAIDRKGTEVFRLPEVETAGAYHAGVAYGELTKGGNCLIDRKGHITELGDSLTLSPADFSLYGLIGATDKAGYSGKIDAQGKIVIPCRYDELLGPNQFGFMIYSENDKYGFLSNANERLTGPDFDDVLIFDKDKILFELDEKWGVTDRNGKLIVAAQFDRIMPDGDLYLIRQGDLFGWCDAKGKIVINPQFEEAQLFGDASLTAVRSGKEYGYIDRKGKFVINPQFSTAGYFSEGLAPVAKSGEEKLGYIDEKGKFVIEPQFERASSFGGGLAIVSKDDRIGFIDKEGLYTINTQFSDVVLPKGLVLWTDDDKAYNYYAKKRYLPCGRAPFFEKNRLLPVKTKDGKTVLIDKTGQYVSNLYEDMTKAAKMWHSSGFFYDFSFAQSDKIDIQPIVERLVACIRGIDPSQTVQQLKAKYGLSDNQFKNNEIEICSEESANSRILVRATCDPWSRVSDGWFGYKRVFNENCIPHLYEVTLRLTGKAADKGDDFVTALRRAFGEKLNFENGETGRLDDKSVAFITEYENEFYFHIQKAE